MKTNYTITLSWETKELMKSNLNWILMHFRYEPWFTASGNTVKFTTTYGAKYRALKRLASQCGATVLQKTINGVDTRMVKVTIQ